MTHTPGPWAVCDDGEPGEPMLKVVGRTARHEIALCCTGAVPQIEESANACLIAAAPDLLVALKHCVIERSEWLEEARAAIAKATGK